MTAAFDRYSSTYRETVARSIAGCGISYDFTQLAKTKVLARIVRERHGDGRPDMLDLGCGVGTIHPLFRPMVGTLSGADVSIDSVREAARANPWATYRAYDGAHLPYAAASFDIAWTSCVLHHVPLAARGDLVAEMRRVTRPGGIVCIVEHNPFNPLTRLAVLRCPFDADAILLRAGETRALLTQAGLAQIALRHFLLLPATGRLVDATEQSLEALPLGAQYVALGSVPA